MLTPSADAFAALARSSPWRWSTLRFTVRRVGRPGHPVPFRAWVRRPDRMRVETFDGDLLRIERPEPTRVGRYTAGGPGDTVALPWPRSSEAVAPTLRPDGLVAERPRGLSYDDPMHEDYFWVAMLDPVELADGRGRLTGDPGEPPLVLESVAEVDHAGRSAWEAVVRVAEDYEPRCADGNCALLRSRAVDLREASGGGIDQVLADYPDAYRVRLDVQTGVCSLTEEIGGLTPGAGHVLDIEAVDEPMDDELFARRRRFRFRRQ